jgi:hypothetical protein
LVDDKPHPSNKMEPRAPSLRAAAVAARQKFGDSKGGRVQVPEKEDKPRPSKKAAVKKTKPKSSGSVKKATPKEKTPKKTTKKKTPTKNEEDNEEDPKEKAEEAG